MALAFDAGSNQGLFQDDLWVGESCCDECNGCNITADFSWSHVSGTTFSFTDTSTGDPANWWHWDFGDGDTSNVQNPSHTFSGDPDCNNWNVTLVSSCDNGATTSSKSQWVSVGACQNPPTIEGISIMVSGNSSQAGTCVVWIRTFFTIAPVINRRLHCFELWINGVQVQNDLSGVCLPEEFHHFLYHAPNNSNLTIKVRITDSCGCVAEKEETVFIHCERLNCGSCITSRPSSVTVRLPGDFLNPLAPRFGIDPCPETERPENMTVALPYSGTGRTWANTGGGIACNQKIGWCVPDLHCCVYEDLFFIYKDMPCRDYGFPNHPVYHLWVWVDYESGLRNRITVYAAVLEGSYFAPTLCHTIYWSGKWERIDPQLFPNAPLAGEFICTGTYSIPCVNLGSERFGLTKQPPWPAITVTL